MEKKITPSMQASEPAVSPAAAAASSDPKGSIKVMKTSYFKPPVTGAGYGVYHDKACTDAEEALWIGRVDANSDVLADLALGTYYVKEFSAPAGYKLDETVYEVNLTSNGQMAVVNSIEPTTEPHGNIKVEKLSYFNDPVIGTGVGIYTKKDCREEHAVDALWIGLNDANSDISVDLPLGIYYVKEFYTLEGNAPDEEIYTVNLVENGVTATVTSIGPTNKPHGNIKVVKTPNSSVPVTGAGYGIYADAGCKESMDALWIGLKDANSDISVDLPAGTYYVKEFSKPDGYDLDKTVHKVTVKNGQTATVTSNEALNALTAVFLKPDGTYYTHLKVNDEFPSVACEEYNVLGWSKTKHAVFTPDTIKSSGKNIVQAVGDYFMESDKITSSGVYYMVAFKERTDSYPVEVSVPKDNTVVYFVGDSRMSHLYDTLVNGGALSMNEGGSKKLDGKVEFVEEMGEGITWFQNTGLSKLESKLKSHKGKNNIIIFNLGVNDAASTQNRAKYSSVFQSAATKLKNIDSSCKLYFANVYPVSNATLYAHDNQAGVTVANIKVMNDVINGICSNGSYTKNDLYDHLKRNGWFYDINPSKMNPDVLLYDGIHPSPTTAASIYQFYIEKTGCKSSDNTATLRLPSN